MESINMIPMLLSYLWSTHIRPALQTHVEDTKSPVDDYMLQAVDLMLSELTKQNREKHNSSLPTEK